MISKLKYFFFNQIIQINFPFFKKRLNINNKEKIYVPNIYIHLKKIIIKKVFFVFEQNQGKIIKSIIFIAKKYFIFNFRMALQQEYDYLFKLLLIGNSSVGKSCLLLRFSDNIFNDNFLPTIGVDFKIRTFDLQNKTIKMQIWDTAGQERFKTITSSYYRGAHGVILVYDITDRQSFNDLENWHAETEKHASEDIVKMLIGNKNDLESSRVVTFNEGKSYAMANGMEFIETSAKGNINIEEAFFMIARKIKEKAQKFEEKHSGELYKKKKLNNNTTKITTEDEETKKNCC